MIALEGRRGRAMLARELFWFVGEELVGDVFVSAARPLFWAARSGRFEVRVVDDLGRSDQRTLTVERID